MNLLHESGGERSYEGRRKGCVRSRRWPAPQQSGANHTNPSQYTHIHTDTYKHINIKEEITYISYIHTLFRPQ